MKIAILGTGNIGSALAGHWAKAGHEIFLGVRDPEHFKGKDLLSLPNTSVHSLAEAVEHSEVVLVATPAHVVNSLIEQIGDCTGKVIIDATNAVAKKPDPYPTAFHAFADKTKAKIVKCFNSTGFENMLNPKIGDQALDMFMAGDDVAAKAVANELALEVGFASCYDFGGNDKVELLEQFALAWINLAIFQGYGRTIGLKLLKRK